MTQCGAVEIWVAIWVEMESIKKMKMSRATLHFGFRFRIRGVVGADWRIGWMLGPANGRLRVRIWVRNNKTFSHAAPVVC